VMDQGWRLGQCSGPAGILRRQRYAAKVMRLMRSVALLFFACFTLAIQPAAAQDPPICDPNGPYYGNVGETIQFDGTGSVAIPPNYITAYEWDFGDGATGSGPTPEHIYGTGATYAVSLIVWDNRGASSACVTDAVITDPSAIEPNTWGRIKGLYR